MRLIHITESSAAYFRTLLTNHYLFYFIYYILFTVVFYFYGFSF